LKNFVGKPYAGKPHVRFDEGAGESSGLPRSTLLRKKSVVLKTELLLRVSTQNKKVIIT
jgi:hypothetical protein